MKKVMVALMVLSAFCFVSDAMANVYVEDFEGTFPAWESGWLGTNSNLENWYTGAGYGNSYRGNNPDGLWLEDGNGRTNDLISEISFNSSFGGSLTSFEIDIAGYVPVRLKVFDMSNSLLLDTDVTITRGATTDPGNYSHYSVLSTNGISKFSFVGVGGSQVEGNTSIDNVRVQDGRSVVPEPASMALLGMGLVGFLARRKKAFRP